MSALATLTPIAQSAKEELCCALRRLSEMPESPFARLEEVHFARWVIVPALPDRHGRLMTERGSYLLFCSDFDGSVKQHLEALRSRLGSEANAVWGACVGYPGATNRRKFGRYLLRHRIRPGYSIVAYPGVRVSEVRQALERRDLLGRFAARAGELDADGQLALWRDTFGTPVP